MSEHFPSPPERGSDDLEPRIIGRTAHEWHNLLTGNNLDIPPTRYGLTPSACAWWAVAGLYVFNEYSDIDDPDTLAVELMGYAVNDAATLQQLVMDAKHVIPEDVWVELRLVGDSL